MTSGRDHSSNHLKLNASVDEEWHVLVRVVKEDTGSGQPQRHPDSRCQQDPGWLPRPLFGFCRVGSAISRFPWGQGGGQQRLSVSPAAPTETASLPQQLKSQN